eukprot:g5003.t1
MTLYFKDPEVVTGEGASRRHVKVLQNDAGSIRVKKVDILRESDDTSGGGDEEAEEGQFGWLDGVCVSCLLNIFGVIMFLRLGWVVGQAGIILAIVIILLSGVVTSVTTMSMAAICTNGQVKAGGAYYLISRSIGPDFGGAIGVLFTLGQCVACAMYVIGFVETLTGDSQMKVETDDQIFSLTGNTLNDMRVYGLGIATILLVMALYGVGWVIKLQIGLLMLLIATILSFCIGSASYEDDNVDLADAMKSNFTETDGIEYNFFSVFAVFFPAVTGIMAGANISGLLRNPSSDIPKGTFHAIGWSTIVYCIMAFLVGAVVSREELLSNYTIMADVELTKGFLVISGIYAATFSSALASIVGAPQLLSSVARDNLFGCLGIFAVTHRRVGFSFKRAPFVDGIDENFARKIKWFLLAQVLYSDETSHSFSPALRATWKKLRKLFEGRLGAEKMTTTILTRQASRVVGTTWWCTDDVRPYTDEDLDTTPRDDLENILVDDLVKELARPHVEAINACVDYVYAACERVETGDAPGAYGTTGLVTAVDLTAVCTLDADSKCDNAVEKVLGSPKFNPSHFATFVMSADANDNPTQKIRYAKCVAIADPIRGYFVSFGIACAFIVMGDLNAVAPLISMFFMMTYSMINYSCFYYSISKSPGWRPTFKYYNPWVSLIGAILCIVCMFLTDVYFALAAIVIAVLMYLYVSVSEPATDWGPATDSMFFMDSVKSVMKLRRKNLDHAKTFRPNYLVLVHGPTMTDGDRNAARFSYTLRKGGGLAILGRVRHGDGFVDNEMLRKAGNYISVIPEDVREKRTSFMQRVGLGINKDKGYVAYTQVVASSFTEGGRMLMSSAGFGSLRPNTVVMRMHVAVTRNVSITDKDLRMCESDFESTRAGATIDIYWILDSGGITLLLPYLMRKSPFWKMRTGRVRLIGLTTRITELGAKLQELKDLLVRYRFTNWEPVVEVIEDMDSGKSDPSRDTVRVYESLPGVQKISAQKQPFWAKRWLRISEIVRETSKNARLVVTTMPFPRTWMKPRDWLGWLEMLSASGKPTVFIRGSGRDVMTHRSE